MSSSSASFTTDAFLKHPLASIKQLILLSIPSILTLFSGSLMSFFDRVFLAHDALESLEGSVSAFYLCQFFQICLSFCTGANQVFVGQCIGANKHKLAGRYTWQMIWFSLASMLVTIPLSLWTEHLFFNGNSVANSAIIYFRCLMVFNFLFPLGIALSSFFLGQGKMQIVLWATFLANVLNIGLDYILIFGLDSWIPSLGVYGAALATGISQLFLCSLLFWNFLKQKTYFGTDDFSIRWYEMKKIFKVGFPRVITKAIILSAWLGNVHLIASKGGDFLLVLSMTSSIGLLFQFINDGMGQGLVSIASYLIGKNEHAKIKQLTNSALLFLSLTAAIVCFPCILFPKIVLSLFFIETPSNEQMDLLIKSCFWLWVFFIAYGLNQIAFSFLTALGDSLFKMIYNIFSAWILNYFPFLYVVNVLNCSADKLYCVMTISVTISAIVYFIRFRSKEWKVLIT